MILEVRWVVQWFSSGSMDALFSFICERLAHDHGNLFGRKTSVEVTRFRCSGVHRQLSLQPHSINGVGRVIGETLVKLLMGCILSAKGVKC